MKIGAPDEKIVMLWDKSREGAVRPARHARAMKTQLEIDDERVLTSQAEAEEKNAMT